MNTVDEAALPPEAPLGAAWTQHAQAHLLTRLEFTPEAGVGMTWLVLIPA